MAFAPGHTNDGKNTDTYMTAILKRPTSYGFGWFITPENGTLEAMVSRVVHLGFEVRIDLELPSGELARAQLTRAQTDELELTAGDIVYIRPPAGGVNVREVAA